MRRNLVVHVVLYLVRTIISKGLPYCEMGIFAALIPFFIIRDIQSYNIYIEGSLFLSVTMSRVSSHAVIVVVSFLLALTSRGPAVTASNSA